MKRTAALANIGLAKDNILEMHKKFRIHGLLFAAAFAAGMAAHLLAEESTVPAPAQETSEKAQSDPDAARTLIYVLDVRDSIGQALMFSFRRGMKDAIANEADVILLDMNTPGGALNVTIEMMQMLDRFDGHTMTFINDEAISAGAFISAATKEIYFAPRGIIGAAAPVMGTGQEIPETMRLKIMSYLEARVRSFADEHPFRTDVIMAMVDQNFVLEIEGEVIKEEGRLLSLTANQAMEEFGDPPRPLLGAGIFPSLEDLLDHKFGEGNYDIIRFEPTWSESLAIFLKAASPVLLALGMVCLFFEFKTPGFGIPGVAGVIMLVLVFFGHHLAGLSGLEPILLFILGVSLIMLEVLVLPGLIFPALIGGLMVLGALIWGMADVWPAETFTWSSDLLVRPLINLSVGLALAIVGLVVLARFLPKSAFWDHLVLESGLTGVSQQSGMAPDGEVAAVGGGSGKPPVGAEGTAVTGLYPSGQIEIEGRRFEARLEHGSADRGDPVEVIGYVDFGLLVRCKEG